MFWFGIAVGLALVTYSLSHERDKVANFFGSLVLGSIVAFGVNVAAIGFYNTTYNYVDAPISGKVQTKVVNAEPSFVFTANGSEYVYPVSDVTVKVGEPHLLIKKTKQAPQWLTVLSTKDARTEVIVTVNPS